MKKLNTTNNVLGKTQYDEFAAADTEFTSYKHYGELIIAKRVYIFIFLYILPTKNKNKHFSVTNIKIKITVQNLKGNTRVLLDDQKNQENVFKIDTDDIEKQSITLQHESKSYKFGFDEIFDASTKQDTIFHEIEQLVQSAMDGYNVCIFGMVYI